MNTIFNSNYLIYPSIIDYKEYFTTFLNNVYKIIIGKIESEIIINCKNYLISFNLDELFLLTKMKFNSVDKAYDCITDIFEENNFLIKNIIKNKEIQINLKINNKRDIEIILLYNKENKDFIIKEINKIKIENEKIRKEINILKRYHNDGSNPENLKLLNTITSESYADIDIDNTFTVFKTIKDLLYLVYSKKNKSIICQDLINQNLIKELHYSHKEYITNIRHYLDKLNKKDYILSISSNDANLKLWDIDNWECNLNIFQVNKNGYLYSACFLNDKNNNYIITSNAVKKGDCQNIKVIK